ncbi:MAG: PAS domain-containing sensor histidine kinase [Myxococcales bacterium]
MGRKAKSKEKAGPAAGPDPRQFGLLYAVGASSPDFTYVFDTDQRFTYVSPPLLRLWGRTLDEVVGKNFADLGYPPHLVELHRRQLDEALGGKVVSGSNSYVSPEGVEGFYEYTFVPVLGVSGRVESIAGTTREVSARVRAEHEKRDAQKLLVESEEQFHHFADAMPQLAWIARADGFIFWYNRRWYEYTGTTPAQMEGWGWQSVHDPHELPRVLEKWPASIRTGEPFEMSFPLRAADGTFRWFLTRATPVRGADGAISRWFGTNTDVDAERRASEERDAALRTAHEALRLRDEFLSIASHELRTPLMTMDLLLATMIRALQAGGGGAPPERLLGKLQRVEAQSARLSGLVHHLLDVSRITSGRLDLDLVHLDLKALADEIVARFREQAEAAHCRLTVSTQGRVDGFWDRNRLDQVLTNLLSNAVKYGEGKPIRLDLSGREGGGVRIMVQDEGIGIEPADQALLFERFQRAASARNFGGFGLGLWICRQIVTAHGGEIRVESRPGAGSTFVVDLPPGAPGAKGNR